MRYFRDQLLLMVLRSLNVLPVQFLPIHILFLQRMRTAHFIDQFDAFFLVLVHLCATRDIRVRSVCEGELRTMF